jgi:hypothetical protein
MKEEYARIKNKQEVKSMDDCKLFIQIPSNLTKAEAEEALKKASEDKVEVDRWYLVNVGTQEGEDVLFLNSDKQWELHDHNRLFDFCKIISPMYTQEEVDKLKEKG